MNSLTPFVHHQLEHRPGTSAAPSAASTRIQPPLGSAPLQPPAPPDNPGTQVPPPEFPLPAPAPHPSPDPLPSADIPITNGTPAGCFQKNASDFLQGQVPGVMAQYADGQFSFQQKSGSRQPAPENDAEAVQLLVDWREEAPYG